MPGQTRGTDGYTDGQLTAISYNTFTQSNVTTASVIGQKVAQIQKNQNPEPPPPKQPEPDDPPF